MLEEYLEEENNVELKTVFHSLDPQQTRKDPVFDYDLTSILDGITAVEDDYVIMLILQSFKQVKE